MELLDNIVVHRLHILFGNNVNNSEIYLFKFSINDNKIFNNRIINKNEYLNIINNVHDIYVTSDKKNV